MRAVTSPARAAGFTMIEAMVVVAIAAVLAAVGVPAMSKWLLARRAQAAAGYYVDGFQTARNLAIEYNAASRLVLTQNATSGQMEWRADLCVPTAGTPCTDKSGAWSTVTTAVTDAYGRSMKSVTRSASGLPPASAMNVVLSNGVTATYFTPVGWLNTAASLQLTRIQLDAVPSGRFPSAAVAVTLAGMASRCTPNKTAPDRRACPS